MRSDEIRNAFLEFFKKKGHKIYESDLLVPQNDPSLLFTGAGMNQFKDQFMGNDITSLRAVTCQKCLRTGDIEKVGKTPRHHTFFEMLGNFSFGDYFKQEAISWAWEFLTETLKIDEQSLWVSVYKKDPESYKIWAEKINFSVERIVQLGPKDNFWPADAPQKGPNGPCGPCTEIFYDWGSQYGCGKKECDVSCDCGRFVEVWNLVFTELDRKPDGSLGSLPNKNIDTGMGLERMTSVLQNVHSNFETDLLAPLVNRAGEILGVDKEENKEKLNLIADHIRAVVFAISDGVAPSNDNRGYVVRKLIRKAYLSGSSDEAFLYLLVPEVVSIMKIVYSEIFEKREHISAVIHQEEEKFRDTLKNALPILQNMVDTADEELCGKDIFKLVDTYGLPLGLIRRKALSSGKNLDMREYEKLMEVRKETSRRGSKISSEKIFKELFKGIDLKDDVVSDDMPLRTRLVCMLSSDDERKKMLSQGETGKVLVSPQSNLFYPESGGQVGDKGYLESSSGKMEILNTIRYGDKKIFLVKVIEGEFKEKEEVDLFNDEKRKSLIAANHSATHLLQAALREVLGDHIKQSGSSVDERRLRFDFTHMQKLTRRQILKVEQLVNSWIKKDLCVSKEHQSLDEAKKMGALSFFGEKYSDEVRVISMGDVSMELCGGSHIERTKDIGSFKIVSESSIASGIRRIEAFTGEKASIWVRERLEKYLERIIEFSPDGKLPEDDIVAEAKMVTAKEGTIRCESLLDVTERIQPGLEHICFQMEEAAKKKLKEKKKDKFKQLKKKLDQIEKTPETISGLKIYSGEFSNIGMEILRKAVGYMQSKITSGAVLLAGRSEKKSYIICALSDDLVDKGLEADRLVNHGAFHISGGGGGRANFAQAGGSDPDGTEKALSAIKELIEKEGIKG